MKTLPNGLNVFNATPHQITFWQEGWDKPVVVEPDEIIGATPVERAVNSVDGGATLVSTDFVGTDKGCEIIARAKELGADVIVGSIIAAQAYPGDVVAMVPAPGYERVPMPLPKEVREALEEGAYIGSLACVAELQKYDALPTKRMRPDRFTTFGGAR